MTRHDMMTNLNHHHHPHISTVVHLRDGRNYYAARLLLSRVLVAQYQQPRPLTDRDGDRPTVEYTLASSFVRVLTHIRVVMVVVVVAVVE